LSLALKDKEYWNWLQLIKSKVIIKRKVKRGEKLVQLYWDLGKMLVEKQADSNWGDEIIIEQLSKDLKKAFPDINGLSEDNLKDWKQFFKFYSQQPVDQLENSNLPCFEIGWGKNKLIYKNSQSIEEAKFFTLQILENKWAIKEVKNQISTKAILT